MAIYIGGTGSANALDDYEEGSWTPQMHDINGSNVVLSGTSGVCKYSKIGRIVNVTFQVTRDEAGSKTGRLEITFLEETGASSLTENLRRRTSSENKNYNLGPTVVIAAINPDLLMTEGMDDETLKLYSAGEGDPLGPVFLKNVKIFEKWDDDHKWRDNAWKLPGRFLYAAYNGINDTICINPNWDGSIGTAYGERLAKNKEEFLSRDMQNSMVDVGFNQPKEPDIIDYKPEDGFEDDPDIF